MKVRIGLAVAASLSVAACQEPVELTLPTTDEIESYYASVAELADVEINGNVALLIVRQGSSQLNRGGTLWAKVGPYVYLFSDETQRLFQDFPGLAGVRVITQTAGGASVANAMLRRDELTDVLWRRALNIAGQARRDGTQRITLIEDLVEWGEDHTEFEYNERYIQRR
ncbi:MAG: hypothetical protein OEO79_01130 [Gemmatimonadota bacterium]|nr:hypothetical protein [Gemmatimonadota bacterium]MDH3422897.1 hypothetical protein [Gemmatimonadota bacterium]